MLKVDAPQGDSPRRERRRWRIIVGLVLAMVACRGIVYVCVLPPFEGWDEFQHVAYVDAVSRGGSIGAWGEAKIDPEFLAQLVALPHPTQVVAAMLGRHGAVDYERFWASHDPIDPRSTPPRYQGGSMLLYQVQHGPTPYLLAAPLYRMLGGAANLPTAVAGLRLANVGLTVAAVGAAMTIFGRMFRRKRDAAIAGLALAVHPLFLLNGARVANDALAVLLATLAVGACQALVGDRRRLMRNAAILGGAVGFAALAKATNFALIPGAAFASLAACVRLRLGVRPAIGAGLLIAGGFVAVVQGEVRTNFARYGQATAMQEAILNRMTHRTPADLLHVAATIDWPRDVFHLWTRDLFYAGGWSGLPMTDVYRLYQLSLIVGLAGWAAAIRGRRGSGPLRSGWDAAGAVVVVAGYTAGLAYHMVQSKLAWGTITTGPWYASAALPWMLALSTAGALAWPIGRVRLAAAGALIATCLAAELVAVWLSMIPGYADHGLDAEALRRIASLRPGLFGTATLLAATAVEIVLVATIVAGLVPVDSPPRLGSLGSPWGLRKTRIRERPEHV